MMGDACDKMYVIHCMTERAQRGEQYLCELCALSGVNS